MRKLLTLVCILACGAAGAQTIPATGGGSGIFSTPPGWSTSGSLFGSSVNFYAESVTLPWELAPLPAAPSGQGRFLSLRSNGQTEQAQAAITGLQPGIWYEIKYHVMTAVFIKNNNGEKTVFADHANLEVSGGEGAFVTHNFAGSTTIWKQGTLKFLPDGTTEHLTFYAKGSSAAGAVVNLDISSISIACATNGSEIAFQNPVLFRRCPQSTVNLNDALPATLNIPNGTKVLWYGSSNHSGRPITDPTAVSQEGDYYAFFYNEANKCFNTDLAKNKVTVKAADVKLLSDVGRITCYNATTFDLTSLHDTPPSEIPSGATLEWFTNPSHSGNAVSNPKAAPIGTYYAFFRFSAPYSCYNTDLSTDKVEVIYPTQVKLGFHKNLVVCTTSTAALPQVPADGVPPGSKLVFYGNSGGSGTQIAAGSAVPIGDYYAFSYDTTKQCLNTIVSTEKFVVQQIPELTISPSEVTVDCPSKTLNLTTLNYNAPVGQLVWYPNSNHSLVKFNPTTAKPGTYWAFYYDPVEKCFNVANSTAKLTVVDKVCLDEEVILDIKVGLQGAMSAGGVMRNNLQTYSPCLLPAIDPYSSEFVYSDIANPNGLAGAIADWVKVEIRDAANPANILETKSLLLKTDGHIVDLDGSVPGFVPQAGDAHIVVKHRNHLAVMSNAVQFTAGSLSYDFTTALDKAFNTVVDPAPVQMVLSNGVWCMIGGDAANDNSVVATDVSAVRNAFNKGDFGLYSSRDHNMDGSVLSTDVAIQRNRFNAGLYSVIRKFP